MEGKQIFTSKNVNHSMMDLVGSAVLPREFSNLDLYDMEASNFFFNPESSYYINDKVIYYVPKVGKPYAAPANYGWYVAKHDIEPGEFNPDEWTQVSLFTMNETPKFSNMQYVNRIHNMQNAIDLGLAAIPAEGEVVNLNNTGMIEVSDFDDMPDSLFDIELPFYSNHSYAIPMIDIALVDFNGKFLTEYVNKYKVKIGYDKQPDGTYGAIYEWDTKITLPFHRRVVNVEPTGDGKLHLIGIDPVRKSPEAVQYVVFGVYSVIE